jgi:LacI family transcriptional regulator
MAHRLRVALIIETSLVYGRRVLHGIANYVHAHQPWSIFLDQREDQSPVPAWLERWRGDGIICRMTNIRLAEAVARSGVPMVDLNDYTDLGLQGVWSDHRAIGRVAAQHLVERGFRHFAFCGFSGQRWSVERQDGFAKFLESAGHDCHIYESRWNRRHSRPWEQTRQRLVAWLESLPKPIGIMAGNDMRGQQVLDACREAEIAVPNEAAVVGVDNDELLCGLCDPPLSSVIPNAERIGYDAAALLDQLMQGERPTQREWLIEPLGIATRQSSDILAIDEPNIAAAVRLIRESACKGVTVSDIAQQVAVSRSVLERGFHKYLGRTPQAEIRQVQVARVKELLAQTELPLSRIAEIAGYDHPEYMCVVFKREVGCTPGQFRQQARLVS